MPKSFRQELKVYFSDDEIRYIESGKETAEAVAEPVSRYKFGSPSTVSVPVLSATASAGGGNNVESIDLFESGKSLAVDREFFGGVSLERVRAIRVEGHSMVPVLLPGSWAFFEEGGGWSGDGLYVLIFRGVLMVKLVEANPATGGLRIRSANPDYESWDYDPTEDQSVFRIVGRVRRVMM
ncbi:S24 family peptidase [Nitratifractor sp.]|uniref:S24 family peptidase n=1 Tax=Nitratifractor sp. TaxID=2268144 RepID=UPI0025F7C571|nr:S24 family peptidase [Nitratifractor sp.]